MPARTAPKTVARSAASQSPKKASVSKKGGKPSKLAKAAKKVAQVAKKAGKAGKALVKKAAPKKKAAALKHYDAASVKAAAKQAEKWAKDELAQVTAKMPLRRKQFTTDSGIPIPDVLTLADRKDEQADRIGLPGQFPFTRGPQPTMYRGRLWTMRQFAGFGTPADTNKRFKYLISHGMTGLSTAFDMPALMGYDADHSMSRGEVGKEGVAISSLRDFEILFDGIQLDKVTTSMTINASAVVALCMYIAVGEKQGVPMAKLAGTIQNDMLKEYIAQKEWIVAPRPAVRIVTDMIEFCTKHMPKWYPVSISGYHIREAGATAVQELAFTLADGIGYVEECVKRGMDVDSFAPQLSFFWDVHNDFFEEIAKFRAARRIWANVMRYRFGAKNPRSWQLKTHAQTAGVSLTAQQPYNNVVRTALQAMAAVLGGTQSLHTNSLDETYALPTEESVTIALRTQQLIAHESGVDRVVDPLAGSYYVEYLTDETEKRAMEYIRRIDEMGGIIRAVEEQYPQKEIGESAYRFQREVEQGDRLIVGLNAFKADKDAPIELLHIDDKVAEEQKARLAQVKAERNNEAVQAALAKVEAAARGTDNMVPPVLEAVKAYATLGEICDVFRKVWGAYREGGAF
ncbi:acyl-CoA mutase large subunit family protein [Hyalangium minutum]|uniref:Methylmalonyl-CoA mutase n=1 Tax=Hyalangium minutum TaxID=394096 RepID=A0A085WR25_9BACT|nr:methylmalonyl-CoA mutase family protein [Hyalangium minutum]KFE70138.1 Methylmalonyl-CoA mutase [Hyalangium minutum]